MRSNLVPEDDTSDVISQLPPQSHPDARPSLSYNVAGPSSFTCDYKDCGKSFKRKEHLFRHAANHQVPSFYCRTCNRGFKRQDLLQRHEKRAACEEQSASPRSKRARSTTSDDNNRSNKKATNLVDNTMMNSPPSISTFLPTDISPTFHTSPPYIPLVVDNNQLHPGPLLQQTSVNGPEPSFEMTIPQDWDTASWQTDPWELLLQGLHTESSNEGLILPDLHWDMFAPDRDDQSAEKAQASVVDVAFLAIIKATIPELDWNLTFLTDALASYWSNVAPTYPFIHRGTFDLESATPQLVVMMAIVGTRHMALESPQDYLKVVKKIRSDLLLQCGFDMPVTTLQAFCLCHVYDTWYGTPETQFVAQCMWPVMVAYTRKKGTAVVRRAEIEPLEEESWAAWAKDEERRRAAFSVLLCDTQLSAFWNQHCSRQLSIFAQNIALPCPRSQWDAKSAAEWIRLRAPTGNSPAATSQKSRSGHLPGLHPEFHTSTVTEGYSAGILDALAATGELPFKVDLENYFGVEMILIGLMAAAWDCRTRGGMGVKSREAIKHWRPIVLKAIIHLRAAWETSVATFGPSIEIRDMRDSMAISITSVLIDIPMLQVASGAPSICGAGIGPGEYKDAQRRLRIWGKTEDAWTCLWQSARYLRQALFADWGIYTPWAVYLNTLVLWAYGWTQAKDSDEIPPPTYNPRSRATHLINSILSSHSPIEVTDHGINDLVVCAAEKLVNGKVEQECSELLWRLVGSHYTKRPVI